MSIDYAITANDADFQKKIKNVRNSITNTSKQIEKEGNSWDKMFGNMGKTIASAFTFAAAGQLVNQIARVRGEFQQLEIAFGTMLQNEEMAAKLMQDVTQFAATTPFDLGGVANGTKQLLAFGSTSAEVIDELRMLGDIAAGLSIPLGDLIYLYGTTRTQGQLFTMDLRQFQGRGIPLAEELAKIFGVTKKEVSDLVTEGKVGFPIVLQALQNMTSEGGKFGGLMEKQSKSITGQLSNLGDAIDQMFNEIGKANEGIIGGAISSVSYLVSNYEKVGKILVELVAIYGAYRAALMVTSLAAKGYAASEILLLARLTAVEKAQKLLNATMLKNPYVLAAAAVAGLCYGLWKLIDANRQVTIEQKAQEHHNKVIEQQAELYQELDEKVRQYLNTLNDEYASTEAKREALAYLNQYYPELIQKYYDEKEAVMDVNGALQEYNRLKAEQIAFENLERLNHLKELKTEYQNDPFNLANQGWTKEEMKLYRGREGQRVLDESIALAQSEVDKDQFNAWQRGLRDLTDKQIQAQIDEIRRKNTAVNNKEIEITEQEQKNLNEKLGLLVAEQQLRQQVAEQNAPVTDKDAEKELQRAIEKAREAQKNTYKKVRDEEMDFLIDNEDNAFTKIDLQTQKALISLGDELMAYRELYEAAGQDTEQLEELYARLVDIEKKKGELAKQEIIDDKMQEKTEKLKEAMEANQTIELQIESINKKYDEQIRLLEENGKFAHADQARVNRDSEVEELRLQQKGFYVQMFSDISTMSTKSLGDILTKAKEYLNTEGAKKLSPENLKEFMDRIYELEGSIVDRSINPINLNASWNSLLTNLYKYKQIQEDINKATSQEEKDRLTEKSSSLEEQIDKDLKGMGVNGLINGLNIATSLVEELAQATGDVTFENAAQTLAQISSTVNSLIEGFKSGGPFGLASAAVTTALNSILNRWKDVIIYNKQAEQSLEDYNHRLLEMSLTMNNDNYDTIFGSLSAYKATEAYKIALQALREYQNYTGKTVSKPDGPTFWNADFFNRNLYEQQLDAYNRGLTELQGMSILASKSFWKGNQYMSLIDYAPELFDENGELVVENAQVLLETNKNLTEEQRKQIANAISLKQKYEENITVVKELASSLLGSYASDITDVIWDAVMSGTDAWEEFQSVGAEVITSLGKQLMQEFLISSYLKQYENDLVKAFGADDEGASIQGVISNIFSGFPAMLQAGSEMAEQWKQYAEEQGIDMSGSGSTTSGSSGGFTTMSQETGSELNGRFTHIQIKTTEIANRLALFEQYHSQVQGLLLMIHNNLYTLTGNSELLKTIDSKLNDIKNNTANL